MAGAEGLGRDSHCDRNNVTRQFAKFLLNQVTGWQQVPFGQIPGHAATAAGPDATVNRGNVSDIKYHLCMVGATKFRRAIAPKNTWHSFHILYNRKKVVQCRHSRQGTWPIDCGNDIEITGCLHLLGFIPARRPLSPVPDWLPGA